MRARDRNVTMLFCFIRTLHQDPSTSFVANLYEGVLVDYIRYTCRPQRHYFRSETLGAVVHYVVSIGSTRTSILTFR